MKSILTVLIWLLSISTNVFASPIKEKLLLIPLDDRPPCLQFPVKLGDIVGVEIITPPKELLGNLHEAGNTDALARWIKRQPIEDLDGLILAADMLAYGGLVASRKYGVKVDTALRRLELIKSIKEKHPHLPVLVQSVIMRLAPTADGTNEAYRVKLAKWASTVDPTEKLALERQLPKAVISDYLDARNRNHQVNRQLIEWANEGLIDYLVLSQDDAKPTGLHVAEKEQVLRLAQRSKLKDKVAIQTGTDEVAMLLLSRLVNQQNHLKPRVSVYYSSETMRYEMMPFEDDPLDETVHKMVTSAGGVVVEQGENPELHWYIYTSRYSEEETKRFIEAIVQAVEKGEKVILSDIDPIGDVQGGAATFSEAMIKSGILPKLYGYASWNTAGNTLGTALPQGFLYHAYRSTTEQEKEAIGNPSSQHWFTIHRMVNDYVYNNTVREALKEAFGMEYTNATVLSSDRLEVAENMAFDTINSSLEDIVHYNFQDRFEVKHLKFELPWNRAFEALIDFELIKLPVKKVDHQ
ncbi:DUF4127 family protein [Echinicola rosea]|uniref:DUF4127 family protein n=1 Tax=Echinicola rosea TaxID=1807691 RepID=A0ABQ1V4N1_9BACT|nr:DUF4127 family protein [Echinicola rosea]GGF38772.1 hypothetical protein GCM10011339_29210 [Echinicola rosea]